jgi:hypothetical protein
MSVCLRVPCLTNRDPPLCVGRDTALAMERMQGDPPAEKTARRRLYRAGWYVHPERPEEKWYWDGERWTDSRPTNRPSQTRRERVRHARASQRARFRVAYDGLWQEEFETLTESLDRAREVSQTGRMTYVIEWRGFLRGHRFRAGFPEERAREAEEEWKEARRRGRAAIYISGSPW